MMIKESELKKLVADGVRRTVNKFREYPHLFFTETDLHAYLYHCLYSKRLEVRTRDGVLTTCLHKEYPTNFRYSKKTMEDYGLERKGRRGNYDIAVLNPHFIRANGIKSVINKDIRDAEERARDRERFRNELTAVVEFKYVINNSKDFIRSVEKDIIKLTHGLRYQDFDAYNLVFCNLNYHYLDGLKEVIKATGYSESRVRSLLAVSYIEGSRKVTPRPLTNGWDF